MEIILSRHGNTFAPHDPVVWAGSTNNLPLVEKGVQQAHKLAEVLKLQNIKLAAIYCGPLDRTLAYGTILAQALHLPFQPMIDRRLDEIDYGEWTGLTNEQINAKFGQTALKEWNESSVWPKNAKWGASETILIMEVHSFVNDLILKFGHNDKVLVVSSNGRLRYFLKLVTGEFEKRIKDKTFKIKTGNVCKITYRDDHKAISYWDIEPSLDFTL